MFYTTVLIMHKKNSAKLRILLIEDNPADQKLTLRAFAMGAQNTEIIFMNDGLEALQYIEDTLATHTNTLPDIILLDINMPRIDGKTFLKKIKENENTRSLPVIMLTTSDLERDVKESYDLGANAYLNKPVSMGEFIELAKLIEDFWHKTSILPYRS